MHNKKESEATDLHDAAPYCYPKRIVGPFYTEERAKQFSHELIHGTRGLESLCKQLDRMLLEPRYNDLSYYGSDAPLEEGLLSYLQKHDAPPAWLDACRMLDEAAEVLVVGE
jgi:hypothetical protein